MIFKSFYFAMYWVLLSAVLHLNLFARKPFNAICEEAIDYLD